MLELTQLAQIDVHKTVATTIEREHTMVNATTRRQINSEKSKTGWGPTQPMHETPNSPVGALDTKTILTKHAITVDARRANRQSRNVH